MRIIVIGCGRMGSGVALALQARQHTVTVVDRDAAFGIDQFGASASGKVVFEKMQANLRGAIGRDTKYKSRSTGKLLTALGVSPVKVNDEGNFDLKIGFSEGRSVNNAMLANILEYGKHGQPPKPILKPFRRLYYHSSKTRHQTRSA